MSNKPDQAAVDFLARVLCKTSGHDPELFTHLVDDTRVRFWEAYKEQATEVLAAIAAMPSSAGIRDEALEECRVIAEAVYDAHVDMGTSDQLVRAMHSGTATAASEIEDKIESLKSKSPPAEKENE